MTKEYHGSISIYPVTRTRGLADDEAKVDIMRQEMRYDRSERNRTFKVTRDEREFIAQETQRRKGGFNSVIPALFEVDWGEKGDLGTNWHTVILGKGMDYNTTWGMLQAIKTGQKFARKVVPNMSIAPLIVTADGFTPFVRRAIDASHVPGMWDTPGSGYMTSWNIQPGEGCADKKWEDDPRLYDPRFHVDVRVRKNYPGIEYKVGEPVALVIDTWQCFEPELGYLVSLKAEKGKVAELESLRGATWVNTTDLGRLIARHKDVTEIDGPTFVPEFEGDLRLHGLALGQVIALYRRLERKGDNSGLKDEIVNTVREGTAMGQNFVVINDDNNTHFGGYEFRDWEYQQANSD